MPLILESFKQFNNKVINTYFTEWFSLNSMPLIAKGSSLADNISYT